MLDSNLITFLNSSVTPGKIPLLDEHETEAVKQIDMMNTLRENCVVWSKSKTTISITKNINNLDISKFIIDIFNELSVAVYMTIDFHGFYSDGKQCVFAWGSRNSSILPQKLAKIDSHIKGNAIVDLFNMPRGVLLHKWFNNHIECMGYDESDFVPYSICSLYMTIQPLEERFVDESEGSGNDDESSNYLNY